MYRPQDDALRKDLFALNSAIRKGNAPTATSSAPVGQVCANRVTLCTLGLHRHFLSDATYTPTVSVHRHAHK